MNENTEPTASTKPEDPADKYLELGSSVRRATVESAPPEPTKEDKGDVEDKTQSPQAPPPVVNEKEEKEKDDSIWSDSPSYEDQYAKYYETTRTRGPFFAVFDLSDPASTLALHALTEKQYPEKAPKVILFEPVRQFCEATSNWKVLMVYNTVQYRKLLPTKVTPP